MMAADCGENQPLRLLISSILVYKKDDASMMLPEKRGISYCCLLKFLSNDVG